jgi:hypothetical protein
LSDRLKTAPELRGDALVWVRSGRVVRDVHPLAANCRCLSSHTVHHFALIALTLRAHGVAVDPKFGVAPFHAALSRGQRRGCLMCTVSWVHGDGGFDLLCNRDEKHTRARAAGPAWYSRGGVQYLAPVDGEWRRHLDQRE